MSFSDHIPSFMMSPPSFATDAIEVRLQFPMTNEALEPHSPQDQLPPFKRVRTCDSSYSNAPPRMNQHPQNPTANKGTSHIFFKTRICAKFRLGACRNGENCNFAHGVEDMRQPPPNWQELVGLHNEERPSSANWDDDQKIIHKMKLCKKFYNGECPYGDKCSFLHEDPAKFRDDTGRFRESTAISIGTNGSPKSYGDGSNTNNLDSNRAVNTSLNVSRGNVKSTYWKTKLCIKFETTGHCPFGDDCHFAHGQTELQIPGGRIEVETVAAGAIPFSVKATIPTVPRATSVSANDAPPSYRTSLPPANEEEQSKRYLLKWKGPKKINRIYGDWLDDLPLVHNLSSGVET
ncbi:hypothetical protein VNO77_24324 [Canavalia gladiata]|uniref:C3H1-type domain-containing protein n=1 Tax=Canavalia gladiata TaxID=3824 RepID=A0AAN9QG50_CANGL